MLNTVLTWVFSAVALLIIIWFIRYAVGVLRGDYGHAKGSKRVWWIPGSGTHGMGEVPPIVPDQEEGN